MSNDMIDKQGNPNEFAIGLKDACCAEPAACCISGCCAPCGFTACWARKTVLDKYANGISDFVCCQGYMRLPCMNFESCCPGSEIGLFCEGCCCPILSLSIARMHLMDAKCVSQSRPMHSWAAPPFLLHVSLAYP